MRLLIDIEDSAGSRLSDGPLETARGWKNTRRLDRAGRIDTSFPAADARTDDITHKRRLRAKGMINGAMTEIGMGIAEEITAQISERTIYKIVGGGDLLDELTYRQVGGLVIDDGAGGTTTTGPQLIAALFPTGWTLDTTTGYDVTAKAVKHTFEGETILAALVRLAELTGEHFRLGTGRKIIWMKTDQPMVSVRAVRGGNAIDTETNDNICLITSLEERQDGTNAQIGRVYAFGSGTSSSRITLNGAACGYAGYTIGSDSKGYYLEHTDTWNDYGIERYMSFKDVSNAQSLLEMTYEWLKRHIAVEKFYKLAVAKLYSDVPPGSVIRVVYRQVMNGRAAVDIDNNLVVLETVTVVDGDGARVVEMVVSTTDRYPDNSTLGSISTSEDYYTHPQPSPGGISGSGVAGQVVIWSGASSIIGDPGLLFDATNDTLSVVGSADAKRVVIQAHATQTNALVWWQNSATAEIARFYGNTSGNLIFGLGAGANWAGFSGSDVIALGRNSFSLATTASEGVYIGGYTGENNLTGNRCVHIGHAAGRYNTGSENVFIGWDTGMGASGLSSGGTNVGVGRGVMAALRGGQLNTGVGYNALSGVTSGSFHVAIGNSAGAGAVTSTGCVFIGNGAGQGETGSNVLYIANTSTTKPLVYGDFSNGWIRIHANPGGTISAVQNLLEVAINPGTAAAGLGAAFRFLQRTSGGSAADSQEAARIYSTWATSDHATRAADLVLEASDAGGRREGLRVRATGSAVALGFYGAPPAVQQVLAAYASDGEGAAYAGIDNAQGGTPYAQLTDLNTLRVAYETLRTSYDDLRSKLVTATVVA